MSDTALALPKPINLPANADGKRLKVGGKLRIAINAMIWDGLPLDKAAEKANLTTAAVRQALAKSHVLQYLKAEREVLRSSINARNITRLAEIRDAADNMPAVNAIKALEQLDDTVAAGSQRQSAPGIVFIINDRNATVAVDDGTARKTIAGDVIKHSK